MTDSVCHASTVLLLETDSFNMKFRVSQTNDFSQVIFRSTRPIFEKQVVTCLIKFDFLKTVLICPPILFQIFNNLKLGSLKTSVVCTSQAAISRNIAINYANYFY